MTIESKPHEPRRPGRSRRGGGTGRSRRPPFHQPPSTATTRESAPFEPAPLPFAALVTEPALRDALEQRGFELTTPVQSAVLPYALGFLFSFNDERLVENVAAGQYFDFVTTTFLAFGLVMEFPILLYGLARVGILTSAQLRGLRRYVLLGIAIFSAIATPGGDLVSPFVLGGTMYLLYEATIFVIKRTGR